MAYTMGVDIGGTKLAYGLFDEQHVLVAKTIEQSLPKVSSDDMIAAMAGHIQNFLAVNSVDLRDLAGIGVAFPGHIYFDKGVAITASNLPTWKEVPLLQKMQDALGVRVVLDNDANVAALAEHRLGAGKGSRDMIYVTLSTGIGSGMILNNALYRGTYGAAGELGHMMMTDNHNICGCGLRGCIEGVGSGTGMVKLAKSFVAYGKPSAKLLELSGGYDQISPRSIYAAFLQQDPLAIEIFDAYAEYMGRFFHNIYEIFNLNTIVFGGGVSKIGSDLMDKINQRFLQYTPMAQNYPMHFVPASFGDEVGMYGAALLID